MVHERLWCFVHEASTLHQRVLSCVFVDASFPLYSPSAKIRPLATFVFASGRTFALLQVLSEWYKTSISFFHWQCFDASDSHLQVSLFFTYYVCSSLILYRFHYAEYLELCASVGATPKAHLLRLQTIKTIVNSRRFKGSSCEEPRRMQVLDLYCLTRFESENSRRGDVY